MPQPLTRCLAVATLATALAPASVDACTSILVSRGATSDGSAMITYVADAHDLYGHLSHMPGGVFGEGTMLDVYDWDSGKALGRIKQAARTYSVVGNMNEHQVAMGETTFGGREELVDPKGGIDYGSLIYVGLQRSRTAREVIQNIAKLVDEYGYSSAGESFSISDPKEVWIMEIIGKGPGGKGAVWVAQRIPDGMVSAHANQSRIRTFPLNDPANCLYSKDVISFARQKGYFKGKDAEFSFVDAYAPADEQSLRACEARVWRIFDRLAPSAKLTTDFIKGKPGAKPLPLWIKPDRKVAVADVASLMRDHFEGTEFDLSKGVGAGPFNLPYRWRPLTWKVGENEYINERAVSTQQTGFSFVAQSRAALPPAIGGLLWFGVDDTASTVYVPIYASIRQVPPAYAVGVGTMQRFSWDSAFWVFNWVANFAYTRYRDIIQDVQVAQRELEGGFLERQVAVEQAAVKLHEQSPELARDYLTAYSLRQADETVRRWRRLGEALLVKYMDGNVKDEHGKVLHPPYPEEWYKRIVAENGEHYRLKQPQKKDEGGPWVIKSRADLGPLAAQVPADFPFDREKLVLVAGTAQCGQLPRCCVAPSEEKGKLVVRPPAEPAGKLPSTCGAPGWLVRVPRAEERPVELPKAEGH